MITDAELNRIITDNLGGDPKNPSPIDTAAKYHAIVPLVIRLETEKKAAYAKARKIGLALEALTNIAGVYALTESDGLDEPLTEIRDGVFNGLVEIDGTDYRFTKSVGDPKRLDNSALTQPFLKSLPDGWTKPRTGVDLDVGYLRMLTPSVLRSKGLCIPDKYTWQED